MVDHLASKPEFEYTQLVWERRAILRCKIPLGTEIFPYATGSASVGPGRLTTIEVVFEPVEVLERLSMPDPATDEPGTFIRLSLGENPSRYDSYLVRESALVETDDPVDGDSADER